MSKAMMRSEIHFLRKFNNADIYIKRDDLIPFSFGGNKVRIAEELFKDLKEKGCDYVISYGSSSSNLNRVVAEMSEREGVPCTIICWREEKRKDTKKDFADNKKVLESDEKSEKKEPLAPGDKAHIFKEGTADGNAAYKNPAYEKHTYKTPIYKASAYKAPEGLTLNERIIRDSSAKLVSCLKFEVRETVERAMKEAEAEGFRPYYVYGDSFGRGNEAVSIRAYEKAAEEIAEYEREGEVKFDYIFLTSGTGMTQSGLISGKKKSGLNARICGISVARDKASGERAIEEKLLAAGYDESIASEIELSDDYLAGGYGKYDAGLSEAVENALMEYGVPLDPCYSGKGYYGMLGEIKKIEISGNVLFIHTGGTAGYLDYMRGLKQDDGVLVSISCITYNHGKYLRDALEGFLNQKCDFKYEILLHDDASTDDTAEIIREYREKYPDIIKPILQAENQYRRGVKNISGVFNFPRARGKYIALCEGDDFWTDPDKLRLQAGYMEAHTECAMTLHSAKILSMDNAYHDVSRIRPYEHDGELAAVSVISKNRNYPTASLMVRTEYAKSLPKFYYDCPVGDIPLQIYMASKGSVYYFDRAMSVYRSGAEGSWSGDIEKGDFKKKWEEHFLAMKRLYEAFDRETDGVYHEACEEACARERFLIDLKTGELRALMEKRNRKFAAELPAMQRRLLKLKLYCPFLWSLLRRARLAVKGRG